MLPEIIHHCPLTGGVAFLSRMNEMTFVNAHRDAVDVGFSPGEFLAHVCDFFSARSLSPNSIAITLRSARCQRLALSVSRKHLVDASFAMASAISAHSSMIKSRMSR